MKQTILLLILLMTAAIGRAATPDSVWVTVRIPVACIRDDRSHTAQMTSQAIMGTPLLVTGDPSAEWLAIKSPDGYEGYMISSSVVPVTHAEMLRWRKSPRLVVTLPVDVTAYSTPTDRSTRSAVSPLTPGAIVAGQLPADDEPMVSVTLPDGRTGWVDRKAVTEISRWADQPFSADSILSVAYRMAGTPYLWGGMSANAVDCSGLVRVAYFASGIILRRDASQQISTGIKIPATEIDSLRPADLLFFSYVPGGRISHVALYDRDRTYIHSSGLVKVNRMSPDDPDFSHRVYRGASRIDGAIPSEGITRVISHPWYF